MEFRQHGIVILLALLLQWPAPTCAKNVGRTPLSAFTLQSYGISAGLPSRLITALHQDASGLLWIGTYGGLLRYDGQRLTAFNRHVNPAVASHNISGILEEAPGQLRVTTASGDVYTLREGIVRRDPIADALPHPELRAVAQGADGAIWYGSFAGLCRAAETLSCFDHDGGFPGGDGERAGPIIYRLGFDATGTLWVGEEGGLVRRTVDGFVRAALEPNERVEAMANAPDGTLWAGTTAGRIGTLGADGFDVRLELGPDAAVSEVAPVGNGVLWFGTYNRGAGRWADGEVQWIDQRSGLATNNIQSLLVDREGVVWIGTTSDLVRLTDAPVLQRDARHGLDGSNVIGMEWHAGTLWAITSNGGLNRYDGQAFAPAEPFAPAAAPGELSVIAADGEGVFWLGLRPGLYRWRPGESPVAEPGFESSWISAVVRTAVGAVWVATRDGLFRREGGGWRRFGAAEGLPSPSIFSILPLDGEALAVGTRLGPALVAADGTITSLADRLQLTDPAIVALARDGPGGALWMGTLSAGLLHFDGSGFRKIDESLGLPDNSIWSVIDDGQGHLWLSSNLGIARVDLASLRAALDGAAERIVAYQFQPSDGLLTPNGIGGFGSAGLRLPDGRLVFATTSGVAFVQESAATRVLPPPPKPRFLAATVDDQPVTLGDGLRIEAGSRRTTIEVTAPTMIAVDHLRLRARLAGRDDRWVELGDARAISYTNLRHGETALELQSSRGFDEWSETVSLPIRILPAWHETTGARLAAALGLLLLLGLAVRHRLRLAHQREVVLGRLVEEKTLALREINVKLERQSTTDSLTKLANRRRFDRELTEEWRRSRRQQRPLSLAFIDVDHFKAFNDAKGHASGDVCLQEIGLVLSSYARRAGDIAARYGGEEFCLLLPGVEPAAARERAESVRRAVRRLSLDHPESSVASVVTVSIGIAHAVPDDGMEPPDLLRAADAALYAAKHKGRDRVEILDLADLETS
ncbi:MAG: diguanylate cyclase [Pseudomonadota bacterium]